MDKAENFRVQEGSEGQTERPENGRESAQWDEGSPLITPKVDVHTQAHDTAKSEEGIHVCRGDESRLTNVQSSGMTSGRVRRIRKGPPPPTDVTT